MLSNRRPQSRYRRNEAKGTQEEVSASEEPLEPKKARRRFSFVSLLRRRVVAPLGNEKRFKVALVLVVLIPLVMRLIVRPIQVRYFGNGNDMEGGKLGAIMDRRNRRVHRRRIETKRKTRLRQLSILLSPLDEARNEKYLTVTSDIVAKRVERTRLLNQVEQTVQRRRVHCESSFQGGNVTAIPSYILQPNYGSWFRPRNDKRMTTIPFDEQDMLRLIRDNFPSLRHVYERSSLELRLHMWSLCALYKYGGYILGGSVDHVGEMMNGLGIPETRSACYDMAAFVVSRESTARQLDFLLFAATPQHPMLKCALDRLDTIVGDPTDHGRVLESLYSPQSWNVSKTRHSLHHDAEPLSDSWEIISSECPALQQGSTCCSENDLSITDSVNSRQDNIGLRQSRILVRVAAQRQLGMFPPIGDFPPCTKVVIREQPNTSPLAKHAKIPIRNVMEKSRCNAGWRCNRCLHNPIYGTYESCESVCDKCFLDLIYNEENQQPRRKVIVDIVVRQRKHLTRGEQRIPRVVHQTWFEDLTVDRYPQLTRVQNSWKNSGYEYRFYTDADARKYIAAHFPSRFLQAYDSLIPGAFKADLFRLLVLLKDGGIYADADVLLGANLDAFITPSMSFFAPLDLVGADYDEEFCLWNGLIGTVPGHPIIVEAVEWLVNRILNRADEYDFERELFRDSGKALKVWKVRQGRLLLLSGPCALGVAANRAMGKSDPVARIDSGWLASEGDKSDIGDSLVLKGDKFDMNAFRFTDIERNLIVSSTDMIDLTTTPMEDQQDNLRKVVHYSEIEAIDDVFGSRGVYADNLVSNEVIQLQVSREFLNS